MSENRPIRKCVAEKLRGPVAQPLSHPDKPLGPLPLMDRDFYETYTVDTILTSDEKSSASTSVILFGHHNSTGILFAGKLFVKYSENLPPGTKRETQEKLENLMEEYNKLSYEAMIYESITAKPIVNIVRWIGTQYFTKSDFPFPFIPRGKDGRNGLHAIIPDELRSNVEGFKIIFTERCAKNEKMYQTISDPSVLTVPNFKSLLFQVLFTLVQIHHYGFIHNDLHLMNILVDKNPKETHITYSFEGQTYKVPVTGGKVLLFDWDLGYSPSLGNNEMLTIGYCHCKGMCNALNARFDAYLVLRSINHLIQPKFLDFQAFRNSVGVIERNVVSMKKQPLFATMPLPKNSILQASTGRMCNYDRVRKECVPFPLGEPAWVHSPAQMIKHDYFKNFRVP
jgi:serine/threonine protein kinase